MGSTGWRVVVAAVAVVWAGVASGKIIYVDDDANSPGDGTTWATAYKYLQDALADASSSPKPVEIRVAQGVYLPDRSAVEPNGTGDRVASFELASGVVLLGGYAGLGGSDPNSRGIGRFETVLSGDIGVPDFVWDNACHVVTISGTDATPVLEGFTITAGSAQCFYGWGYDGGGMRNVGSPLVRRCRFEGNGAYVYGAGVSSMGGNPVFMECVFVGNGVVSDWTSIPLNGGGICSRNGRLKVVNCVFAGNTAYGGGAIDCSHSAALVENCTFSGNRAFFYDDIGGSAVCAYKGVVVIHNSILWGNFDTVESRERAQVGADEGRIEIDYSCVEGWSGSLGGVGNIGIDPYVAHGGYWADSGDPNLPVDWRRLKNVVWVDGDYHLKSQGGRWLPDEGRWTTDEVTSPCIDAGDPLSPVGHEPFPNGGRVNMGAYGGTAEASKSYFGYPFCETIVAGDINGDCRVDFTDVALLMVHWLADGAQTQ